MDEVPPTVFRPNDSEKFGEFAIIIDAGDAPLLRDVLRKASEDRAARASRSNQRAARERNAKEAAVLGRYAERCEYVRLELAKEIGMKLGLRKA